jgi:hypothetical protein
MWHDPYILGFTHRSIEECADFANGFKATPKDLGFALIDTYAAITNMNGKTIAQNANDLAVAKNPEYERGAQNATAFFLHCHNGWKDTDNNPVVAEVILPSSEGSSDDA